MKRGSFLLLLLWLTLCTARAQQPMALWIEQQNGETQMLRLEQLKLTFSEGSLIAQHGSGQKQTIRIADITKLFFRDDDTAVRSLPADEPFLWSPLTQELTAHCPPGTLVTVYDAGGRCVSRTIQTLAGAPISLSSLPKGVYVVSAAGQSAKFVRR